MFARFEVLAFNRLLRRLDAAGDELRFDGHALFHPQPLKQVRHPLLGEDAHQVIFERKIEARGAGIALATGTPAKLVVDAARLMALSTENVQAPDGGDLIVLYVSLRFVAVERLRPFIRRDGVFVTVVVENRDLTVFLRSLDLSLSHA